MLDFNSASRLDEFEAMATGEAKGGRDTKPNRVPFRDVPPSSAASSSQPGLSRRISIRDGSGVWSCIAHPLRVAVGDSDEQSMAVL